MMRVPEVAGLADDDGAQPQRTALAWQRSVLAAVLGALLVALGALRRGAEPLSALAAVGALALVVGVLVWVRRPGRGPWDRLARLVAAVVAVAAAGTALAVVGIVLGGGDA
ncbi:conserved hypothetical protein [Beutenbergia cavernae DSM 12333]|uniref:DUF202 domain-containing protein n=1 Tax=Beutenbergia cavernae (strain ATCC BAA-8 / DSM 12333 / CCUG 43141 / JCM 11478 / NBRC 16432 / NCIMB 13614 / HKI 0122) TaxID=471853 RepID=C5BZ68_BEUC1|nr:DUF202 domain-containing protein [Beutenbergia cavernae]ACQ81183.1 conserved hypothetical protein [Beutenbergia cavernae DSM 12333]